MLVTHESRRTFRMSSTGLLQSAHRNRRATLPHIYRRSVSSSCIEALRPELPFPHCSHELHCTQLQSSGPNCRAGAATPSPATGRRRHRPRCSRRRPPRQRARSGAAKKSGGLFATTASNPQSAGASPAKSGSRRRRSRAVGTINSAFVSRTVPLAFIILRMSRWAAGRRATHTPHTTPLLISFPGGTHCKRGRRWTNQRFLFTWLGTTATHVPKRTAPSRRSQMVHHLPWRRQNSALPRQPPILPTTRMVGSPPCPTQLAPGHLVDPRQRLASARSHGPVVLFGQCRDRDTSKACM